MIAVTGPLNGTGESADTDGAITCHHDVVGRPVTALLVELVQAAILVAVLGLCIVALFLGGA